jgi:3,5-epimerase/4-reductase
MGKKVSAAATARHILNSLVSHHAAQRVIEAVRPKFVLNCAAVTGTPNVDYCESHKAQTIEGNTVFPIRLSLQCRKYGLRFAHFSSGCIYQGDGNYTEDDAPNFGGSTYAASKLASDTFLKNESVVFRIRMPFDGSRHPRNLLTKLDDYSRKATLVDSVNSLSDADEMADAAVQLLAKDCPNGAYNLVNGGSISTRDIAQYLRLSARWESWEDFSRTHAPRSACTLSNAKASALVPLRDVHEALAEAAKTYVLQEAA